MSDCSEEIAESAQVPKWITIRQAARRSGIPTRTLYNWIEQGTWPVRVVNLGERKRRVRLEDFERWLESLDGEDGESSAS
jgi:excisionase family DNA binding protein